LYEKKKKRLVMNSGPKDPAKDNGSSQSHTTNNETTIESDSAKTPSTSMSDKLAKFGEPDRTPRRFDTPASAGQIRDGADPRIQAIHETVKDLVRAHQAKGAKFEVESRTDVQRYLRVATAAEEELLLINTDVYIPGRWFIRRQWRRVGEEPGDEYFVKSANTRKGSR
jgi:hypothetical protein